MTFWRVRQCLHCLFRFLLFFNKYFCNLEDDFHFFPFFNLNYERVSVSIDFFCKFCSNGILLCIWNLRPPPSVIEKKHPKFPFWLIATFSRWKSENKQRGHNRKHVVLSPGLQSYLSGCRACHTPPQWLWSCSFNRPKVTSKQKTNMTSINHTTTTMTMELFF